MYSVQNFFNSFPSPAENVLTDLSGVIAQTPQQTNWEQIELNSVYQNTTKSVAANFSNKPYYSTLTRYSVA